MKALRLPPRFPSVTHVSRRPLSHFRTIPPRLAAVSSSSNPLPAPSSCRRAALPVLPQQKRFESQTTTHPARTLSESGGPTNSSASASASAEGNGRAPEPAYQITFTCRPCEHRSSHRMSKQAYHYGAVLVKCPNCNSRHVMSDHLGIFTDKGQGGTLDDILAKYGSGSRGNGGGKRGDITIKKGFVEGDLEFYDDGTVLKRKEEEQRTGAEAHRVYTPETKTIDLGPGTSKRTAEGSNHSQT